MRTSTIEGAPGGPPRNLCARESGEVGKDDKPEKKDEGLMLINAPYTRPQTVLC